MRFEDMERRVGKLEAVAIAGKIATTDDEGRPAWVEGSGLRVAFNIMWLQDDLGRDELKPDDLPDDLRREVSLWSRAAAESQAERMTKQLCEGIMGRFEL